MKSLLESRLHQMWSGGRTIADRVLAGMTLPLALLFRLGVALRGRCYDLGIFSAQKGEIPVISVGNLAVGGTGKTPVSAWLVRELVLRGRRPALIARGYGEDEMLLHQRWNPEVPLIRAIHRIDGVREAVRMDRDIAVLDDGFQHRALHRDLDLLLLSPAHSFPARLLPAGPFREPWEGIWRSNHILVTAKGGEEIVGATSLADQITRIAGAPPVEVFPLIPGEWETMEGETLAPPSGTPLVLTSIAAPKSFFRMISDRAGGTRGHLTFPDHHPYSAEDVARISSEAKGGWIATTEKDAVKLIAFRELLPEVRVLPLVPQPAEGLTDRLMKILDARLAEGTPG